MILTGVSGFCVLSPAPGESTHRNDRQSGEAAPASPRLLRDNISDTRATHQTGLATLLASLMHRSAISVRCGGGRSPSPAISKETT